MLLLVSSLAFSQTTYPKVTKDSLVVITQTQLRKTNLIFLEHRALKAELLELRKQTIDYTELINQYRESEHNRKLQVDSLMVGYTNSQSTIQVQSMLIDKQSNKLKRIKKVAIGGVTLSAALLITLILVK